MQIAHYQILGSLGEGAMGAVLKARDPYLNRDVAIKVLQGASRESQLARARFQREAQLLARIRHPHVVPVLSAGEDQGRPYLVMELIRGESLEERLHRGGPLPPAEAAALVRKLADALAYAHAQGVLHRDVKPANVLLDGGTGEPLLTDFGLAVDSQADDAQRLTRTGHYLGTPGYWAPEQAAGELSRVGPASDVYGLGATLYALLTGGPPVPVGSLTANLAATPGFRAASPAVVNPRVEPWLAEVCLRCLEPAPERRYPTAEALSRALEGPPGRGAQAGRRGSLLLVAVGLVLLAVVGAAWILTGRRTDTRSPRGGASPPPVSPPDSASLPGVSSSGAEPRAADEALARGRACVDRQDWPAAVRECTRALAARPGDPEALACRAHAYYSQGQLDLALADLDLALTRDPAHVPSAALRALLHQNRKAWPQARADAEVVFRNQERATPLQLLCAYSARAGALAASGDREAAAADWRATVELLPAGDTNLPVAWHNLGQVLDGLGRPDEALAAYSRALALAPGYAKAWYHRANLHLTQGRLDEAVADYSRGLEVAPGDVDLLHNRAVTRLERGAPGDAEGAAEDLRGELARRPDPRSECLLARALANAGRRTEALALLDALVLRAPDKFCGWQARGELRLEGGHAREALEDLERAGREGAGGEVLLPVARARRELGDVAGAIRDLERLVQLYEEYLARSDVDRTVAWEKRRNLDRARGLLEELRAGR